MLGHLASFRSLESTAVMFMQTLKGNTKLASRLHSRGGQGLGDGGQEGDRRQEWEMQGTGVLKSGKWKKYMWEEIMQQYIIFHNQKRVKGRKLRKRGSSWHARYRKQEAWTSLFPCPFTPTLPHNHLHLAAVSSQPK